MGAGAMGSAYEVEQQWAKYRAEQEAKKHPPQTNQGTANTKTAKEAVQGIPHTNVTGGGPGSQYSVDNEGRTNYVVTPDNFAKDEAAENARYTRDEASANSRFEREQAAQRETQQSQRASQDAQYRLRAQLQADAEKRRMEMLGGAFPPAAPVEYGAGGDEAGARSAAFTRAKEQAGQTAQGSLSALQGVMDSRGMTGSTLEGSMSGEVLRGAGQDINDQGREQLIQDLTRQRQVQDARYQGGIQQRGQDLGHRQSLLSLMTAPALY